METVDRRALPTVPTAPTAAPAAVSILPRFPNSTPKGDTFQLNTTDEERRIVKIVAIGHKVHNKLFIHGEEYEL